MKASRGALMVASMLLGVLVQPAASDNCAEKDLDAEGRCPTASPPVKPTQLDIQGPDIAGVPVLVDRRQVSRGPLVVPTTPGRHLIEVKRDGYAPYSAWIEVKQGERKLVQVKLQPVSTAPAAAPAATAVPPSAATAVPPPPPPPVGKAAACLAGMVRIPAGTFKMGSPEEGFERGYPQHAVTLSAYCIDKTEVTVKAYGECVAAKGCTATDGSTRDCNRDDRPDHPINCVDWHQAAAYCKWAGKRLPTEAEWEYAARGTDGREYPWGNGWADQELPADKRPKRMNQRGKEDGWEATAPVGSFPAGASPFGVLDMAGNVSEWTEDRFGTYPSGAVTNPQGPPPGPSSSASRMRRGGSWYEGWPAHRTHQRSWAALSLLDASTGVRCAK